MAIDAKQQRRSFGSRILRVIWTWFVLLPTVCIGLLALGVTVALWNRGFFADASASRVESRMYSDLDYGMNLAEVEQLFGRSPDYVCKIETFSVLYFFQPGFDDDEYTNRPAQPNAVEVPDDIPWIYGSKQILLDSNGQVVAYSWNGEESYVHTFQKAYDGSAINELPGEFFDSLRQQE